MGRKRKSEVENSCASDNSNSSSMMTNSVNGIQRLAANDRERTRMRVLSKAFVRLKTSLPWVPTDTKLSKLDTLKLATSYISYLTRILSQDDQEDDGAVYFQPPTYHHYHQASAKMLPSIRLSAFDMQKIINEHLSSTNCHALSTNQLNTQSYSQMPSSFVKFSRLNHVELY